MTLRDPGIKVGPMPVKLHERHAPVAEARLALGRTLHILEEQFELTAAELMVLLSAELQSLASSCVREERRGE